MGPAGPHGAPSVGPGSEADGLSAAQKEGRRLHHRPSHLVQLLDMVDRISGSLSEPELLAGNGAREPTFSVLKRELLHNDPPCPSSTLSHLLNSASPGLLQHLLKSVGISWKWRENVQRCCFGGDKSRRNKRCDRFVARVAFEFSFTRARKIKWKFCSFELESVWIQQRNGVRLF